MAGRMAASTPSRPNPRATCSYSTAAVSSRSGSSSSTGPVASWSTRPRDCWSRRYAGSSTGTANAAVADERRDEPARGAVDRDGEPQSDPGERGVHADDAAAPVCEPAPGVAGVERSIGLDDVLDDAVRRPRSGGEGAAERA